MKNKKYEKKQKNPITYYLSHQADRVLSYLLLLVIPVFVLYLMSNFNNGILIFFIIISICLCFWCWWINSYKIKIYDNEVIVYNIKKRVIKISEIQSLTFELGYIYIGYNDKVYKFGGFVDWADRLPLEDKNKVLLDLISKKVVKLTKRNKVIHNDDLVVIAEKRMWTIIVELIYLLFGIICFWGLLSNWNTVVFVITAIIFVICIPLFIDKIFTPKKIILYDTKKKELIINKAFKTIRFQISDIKHLYYSIKASQLYFKLKNNKRIYVLGVKNIMYAVKNLRKFSIDKSTLFY